MTVRPTALAPVLLLEPGAFGDSRGYFVEVWRRDAHAVHGLPETFVQDNLSRSGRGVLRGLHLQEPHGQGKLVHVPDGEVFDVAVDVRVGSPTFGRWVGETLSEANHRQLYVPPGFAHGFCVLSESALVAYKCTAYYDAASEVTVVWNDPALGITWPVAHPVVSPRDASAPRLQDVPRGRLPRYEAARV